MGVSKSKGRLAAGIAAFLIFVMGVGLISYPYVSDYLHKLDQGHVMATQAEVIDNTDSSAIDAARAAAEDYNSRLLSSRTVITDPFDPDAQTVGSKEYRAALNLAGDGVMGQIIIPKLNVMVPMYHGAQDSDLQRGVGHMVGTSLPVGGPNTHAVLAGHNGLPSMKVFDNLDRLGEGDYFVLRVLGEDMAYRVTGVETVLPNETESLAIEEGRDLVTLVTCTPYGVNTHRLLVHAERCEIPADWLERTADGDTSGGVDPTAADAPLLPFTLMGLGIGLGALVAWVLHRVTKQRRAASAGRRSGAGAVGGRSGMRGIAGSNGGGHGVRNVAGASANGAAGRAGSRDKHAAQHSVQANGLVSPVPLRHTATRASAVHPAPPRPNSAPTTPRPTDPQHQPRPNPPRPTGPGHQSRPNPPKL